MNVEEEENKDEEGKRSKSNGRKEDTPVGSESTTNQPNGWRCSRFQLEWTSHVNSHAHTRYRISIIFVLYITEA